MRAMGADGDVHLQQHFVEILLRPSDSGAVIGILKSESREFSGAEFEHGGVALEHVVERLAHTLMVSEFWGTPSMVSEFWASRSKRSPTLHRPGSSNRQMTWV